MKMKLPETAVIVCDHCATNQRSRTLTPMEEADLKPKAFVKINRHDEGFFVEVTKIEGNFVTGIVRNDLVLNPQKSGDEIEFERSAIYEVLPPAEENRVFKLSGEQILKINRMKHMSLNPHYGGTLVMPHPGADLSTVKALVKCSGVTVELTVAEAFALGGKS